MGRLSQWWQRVRAGRGSHQPGRSPASRPAKSGSSDDDTGLAIAPDPEKVVRRTARTGAAGFDPYSSDGGYAKPSSWDRLDHD